MSTYTQAQITSLHAAIVAEPTMAQPLSIRNDPAMAVWLNSPSTFVVWQTYVLTSVIQDAVTWANFTPANPAAGAGQDFLNWCAQCALKRDNLWSLMSAGNGSVSTGKTNIRAGLQDALTGIPSGVAGANRAGGWPAVQLAIQRFATNAEKVFATGTGTSVTPGDLVFERFIPWQDIPYILEVAAQP